MRWMLLEANYVGYPRVMPYRPLYLSRRWYIILFRQRIFVGNNEKREEYMVYDLQWIRDGEREILGLISPEIIPVKIRNKIDYYHKIRRLL